MPALPCPDTQCLRWWSSVDPATITVSQTDHLKAVLIVTIRNLAPLSDKLLIDLLAAAEEDDRWLPLAQHLPEALAGQSLLPDLQASCLLLGAVSTGCRWSALMLSLRLAERAVAPSRDQDDDNVGLRWCLGIVDLTPTGSVLPAQVAQEISMLAACRTGFSDKRCGRW